MVRVQTESAATGLQLMFAIAVTLGVFVLGVAAMMWGAVLFDRNVLGFLGIVASGAMAFMAVVLTVETMKHNFANPHAYDELRSALVAENLSKSEADAAVEQARELEAGEDLTVNKVTVARLEDMTFLVGVEK